MDNMVESTDTTSENNRGYKNDEETMEYNEKLDEESSQNNNGNKSTEIEESLNLNEHKELTLGKAGTEKVTKGLNIESVGIEIEVQGTETENIKKMPDTNHKLQSKLPKVRFRDEVERYNLMPTIKRKPGSQGMRTANTERHKETYQRYNRGRYKPTIIAKASTGVDKQMKMRGYKMVEDKQIWETPVKIEFNLDKTLNEFNVQKNVVELLDRMKTIDTKLLVKSTIQENIEWVTPDMLPEDEDFNNHFQLKEFTYRKLCKIVVHVKIIIEMPINNRIKYSPVVREHIFENNIWLKTDRFNAKIESSPGNIMMLHPKRINRDGYSEELVFVLSQAKGKL